MSLHFLVDGYNVIKQVDSLRKILSLKQARMSLIEAIQERKMTKAKKAQITIVFDGKDDFVLSNNQTKGSVKVIFSKGESADETIKRMVGDSRNPKQIVVVTDDKAIIFFIRSLKSKAMSVDEFFNKEQKKLDKKATKNDELAKIELTYQQQQEINQELRRLWQKVD